MALSHGDKLGPYEIIEPIGKGGMGEVFRAHDPRTGRDVAIKISAEHFSERFDREVRAVAALNHPNICHLYDVGPNYLVMELIEGSALKGPLPVDQALKLAAQICDALDAAHKKGITHRDLKPSNILVTKAGVKLLDFGLAKSTLGPAAADDSTITSPLTVQGEILGTLQYMSPEQVQGQEADSRSDIFSFGLVLYEMLTGKRAFEGSTPTSIIAAILEREAPKLEPEGLNRVVRTCLAKDPADRFQTARDLKRAIEWSVSRGGETPLIENAPEPGVARRLWLAWSVAAVATVGFATVAYLHFRGKPPAPAVPMRFQIQAPGNSTLDPLLKLSPDGRKLAFTSGGRLWVHFLESGESRDLTTAAGTPFWSPDSRYIGYPEATPYQLKRIEATGGPPQTVTDLRGLWGGGTWSQDDVIVFSDRAVGLLRVPASGGVPVPITAFDSARRETDHDFPSFLPDGRHFVYTRRSSDLTKSAVYLGSVDAKPEQQSSKPLANSNWHTECVPSADPGIDYLLFVSGGTLMAQPFDNRRLELTGQAAPVAEQLNDGRAFSSSANNILVFQQSPASNVQLAWYDREGKILGTTGDPGDYQDLALSSDGKQLAVTKGRLVDTTNIWLLDLSRSGASTRFTFGSLVDRSPVWSPDGSRIIFSSNRDGPFNLYQKPVNGVKDEEVLLKSNEDKIATSWSHDGGFLLYSVIHPRTKSDIWVLPLDNDRKPVPFLITEFNESQPRFSPDGHWVAYTSDESGQNEVYVRSFSMNSARTAVAAGGKWLISNGGGAQPRWRGDGQELFYRSGGGRVMAIEIATKPAFRAGSPQSLGSLPGAWDSAADGKRFLVLASKSGPQPYTVVLNWQAGLKK